MLEPKKDVSIALRELLDTGQVRTQEDIAQALENLGYQVSQSKISRLLHKIAAIKVVDSKGRASYRLSHEYRLAHELTQNSIQSAINQMVLGISASDVLIVVHTNPGAASLVARILDQEKQTLGILGCIAGDDTIFVAPKHTAELHHILTDIKTLLMV